MEIENGLFAIYGDQGSGSIDLKVQKVSSNFSAEWENNGLTAMLGLDGDVNYTHSFPISEDDLYLVWEDNRSSKKIYGSRLTSLEIQEVASGFRLQIKQKHSASLSILWNEKSPRVSKALMETISIIAYKQPVTRGDIEDIRGITVSTRIIRSLLERNWIKVSGNKDVPGRPALYVTTKDFLNDLNLKNISDLPELPEREEVEEKNLLTQAV